MDKYLNEYMDREGNVIFLDKARQNWQPKELDEEDAYIFETAIEQLNEMTEGETLRMKGE